MAKTTIGLYEEYLTSAEEIPVRVTGDTGAKTVARKHLSARDPNEADEALQRGEAVEEPLDMDYEVVPYSPTENSKAAQIKKLSQFLEVLMISENVDQRKLMSHLLDVLDIGRDVLVTEEALQAQQMQQMQASHQETQAENAMGMAGPGPEAPGEDTMATGGMPPGVPAIPTEAIGGMAGGAGFPTPQG
jgi:hypothetical protein